MSDGLKMNTPNKEDENFKKLAGLIPNAVTEIAKKQPYCFVTIDKSMANDSVVTNFELIFATYSPSAVRKVL